MTQRRQSKNQSIIRLSDKYLTANYGRYPVVLTRGKGMQVWDKDGNSYLDFVAGVAVDSMGHCHPKVVQAIQSQSKKLIHVSNWFHIEPQTLLARDLVNQSFADRVFFCNSGTEANEVAIKLARRYSHDRGHKKRTGIITTLRSFHGRTLGALAATGQKKMKTGFGPMLPGFVTVPFDDIDAIKRAIKPTTCAIMVEPIQGETGIIIPSQKYIKALKTLCRQNDLLLIFDEVQTGIGRTGTLFSYEGFGVKPDIMTLAKGLGGGFPIGAMLATEKVAKSLGPGTHGSTFGGNPLACATAQTVFKFISRKTFLKKVKETGEFFLKELQALAKKNKNITQVRGRGMMLAIDIKLPSPDVARACLDRGILVNSVAPSTLRFIPPLIVGKKDIRQLIKILREVLK